MIRDALIALDELTRRHAELWREADRAAGSDRDVYDEHRSALRDLRRGEAFVANGGAALFASVLAAEVAVVRAVADALTPLQREQKAEALARAIAGRGEKRHAVIAYARRLAPIPPAPVPASAIEPDPAVLADDTPKKQRPNVARLRIAPARTLALSASMPDGAADAYERQIRDFDT